MKFKSVKFWINAVTIVAMIGLVIIAREQILEAFKTFADLNLFWLVLIIPAQLANHYSTANFYKSYLKTLGENVRLRELYKISLEMNFVNNVFPSGGVSGFGYLGIRLGNLGVPGSKSTLIQTSRHILTILSMILYLLIAVLLLSLFGSASRFIVMIASSLSTLIVFITFVLIYIISDEKRIKTFTAALPKFVNSLIKIFRSKSKVKINIEKIETLFGDLHVDYLHVRKNWKELKRPFFWTTMMNLTEIVTIFVVYLSFAELVNPGAIIIAYAVANVAGLVAILPGGVGVYEGLMTAVMTSAGIEKGLALSATLVYRVFNMGIFLPIGYFFYQRNLRQSSVVERIETEEIVKSS